MTLSQESDVITDPISNAENTGDTSPSLMQNEIDALINAATFEKHDSAPEIASQTPAPEVAVANTAPKTIPATAIQPQNVEIQLAPDEDNIIDPNLKTRPISVNSAVRILNEHLPIDLKAREDKLLLEKIEANTVAEMIKNGDDGIIRATPTAKVAEKPVPSKPVVEAKKVSTGVSDQEAGDMETFFSSMGKAGVKTESAPTAIVTPTKKSEEHMGQTGGEWSIKDSKEAHAEPDATLLPGLEGATPSTEKKPSVPPPIPEWYVKKQLEEKEQREAADALVKENADLKKQIAELTNNHAGEIGKLADRIKGLEAQASREAGLEDIIRGFEKKIAELMNTKREGGKAGEKKPEEKNGKAVVEDNKDVIIATEADIVPEDKEQKTPQDMADLYKRYRFGSEEERKGLKLDASVIGIGANKYFEEVNKDIVDAIHERNHLYLELENEKHSLLKRTATLGLSGTYRRSAHNEGVNRIKPRIKFLTEQINIWIKNLKKIEKDTRKSPQVISRKERKKQIKRLKGIAA